MHAPTMSLQVRLADELPRTISDSAGEGVFPLLVVGLHMCFVVVAATEQLIASLDLTPEASLFRSR
jgi:hypothetical protein